MKTSTAKALQDAYTNTPIPFSKLGYDETRTLSDPNAGKVFRQGRWIAITEINRQVGMIR